MPLAPPPAHNSIIIAGVASSSAVDIDRVSFVPFCFGSQLPTVPLLVEHDSSRSAGTVAPTYDAAGALHVRATVTGEARRYGAFSVSASNIQFKLVHPDRRDFYAQITSATLTEISLTEFPHLPTALILNRMPGDARGEFYDLMARRVNLVSQLIPIIQKGLIPNVVSCRG